MAYKTSATTKGGRDGRAVLENGGLALGDGAAQGAWAARAKATIRSSSSRSAIPPASARRSSRSAGKHGLDGQRPPR